jgi:hypothetical protein
MILFPLGPAHIYANSSLRLLALFGEQFAKQFMSESSELQLHRSSKNWRFYTFTYNYKPSSDTIHQLVVWLDHIVFAMAPLGIITAIVGAIRVGGPPWLRSVIGRARENRAAPEVELMSSTSHEVCELWNGQTVVRMVGRPEIQQLVYLEDSKGCFDLYTMAAAINGGYLQRECMMEQMPP